MNHKGKLYYFRNKGHGNQATWKCKLEKVHNRRFNDNDVESSLYLNLLNNAEFDKTQISLAMSIRINVGVAQSWP